VPNPFLFAQDVYQYGKARELASFAVWELYHRLGLFPKDAYLKFDASEPVTLKSESLAEAGFSQRLGDCFGRRGLRLVRSPHNWKQLFLTDHHAMLGAVYPEDRDLYRSLDRGGSIAFVKRFPEAVKSIFVSRQNTILVCVKGAVYRSLDHGGSFTKSLDLASSESYFRPNNAMTETPDQTLVLGEYGNVWERNRWKRLAYLYFSSDQGQTWARSDFLIGQGINKHVHLVKYSRLLNRLLLADGDNKKKLWISDPLGEAGVNLRWHPVNRYHIQMGGYTSAAETDGKIVFGTDYQGGTNFIVETTDGVSFTRSVIPDPYRRSPIDNMVLRKSKRGIEIWANLPYSSPNTKCLLMVKNPDAGSWTKVIEYNRATHKVWLISSSREASDVLYFSVENSMDQSRAVYRIADE
jgi:hypothetical protein